MTSYSEYLGDFVTDPKRAHRSVLDYGDVKKPKYSRRKKRYGVPTDTLDWSGCYEEREACILAFYQMPLGKLPNIRNEKFMKHIKHFLNNLFAYDQIVQNKVFNIEEIYLRCLTEGPDFTKFIKKSRHFSLQYKISYTDGNIPDEYIHEEYDGYDSIIHERYLINWDETGDTLDWPYSLLEVDKSKNLSQFTNDWRQLWNTYHPSYKEGKRVFTFFQKIAQKKSSLLDSKKTVDLKNTWNRVETFGPYIASRRVVPVEAGNIRDTGVPDLVSLNKLKVLHKVVQEFCDRIPYSANTNFRKMNKRIERVRRKALHCHLDFKKFGLTFPREPINLILESIGLREYTIDVLLEVDGKIYETERGGVLGWFDQVVSLATITILVNLAKRENWRDFDMVQFNDDIEIGFDYISREEAHFRQQKMCLELESFGFLMSWRKIFTSEESIFLEDYAKFENRGFDMTKIQLAVMPFGKALSTQSRAEAKMLFAHGACFGYTDDLRIRIQEDFAPLFEDEYNAPIELGGWKYLGWNGLNTALEYADFHEIKYFLKMKDYKEPELPTKVSWIKSEVLVERHYEASQRREKPFMSISNIIKLDDRDVIFADDIRNYENTRLDFPEEEKPILPPRVYPRGNGG